MMLDALVHRPIFADGALALRIERADARGRVEYLESLRRLYPDVSVDWDATESGTATHTDNDPYHSRVGAIGHDDDDSVASIERFESFVMSCGGTPSFDVAPHAGAAFARELCDRGYRIEHHLNVLGCRLDEDVESARSSQAVISLATPSEIDLWVGTAVRGFEVGLGDAGWFARLMHAYASRSGTFCFLARVDGHVAGAGALSIGEGLAWLHATSVIPGRRRHGVHRALLGARLSFAARAGCDLAVVHTRVGDASQRNVERAGFRVLYTRATYGKPTTTR